MFSSSTEVLSGNLAVTHFIDVLNFTELPRKGDILIKVLQANIGARGDNE